MELAEGERTVSELTETLPVSQPTSMRQLRSPERARHLRALLAAR